MKAAECKFHVKKKYGQCWRSDAVELIKPLFPEQSRCDGRERACPLALPKVVQK